jgi:hypothetical protein
MSLVVNDPRLVESNHLPPKSKSKPYIYYQSFKQMGQVGLPNNATFEQCQGRYLENGTGRDVGQFWKDPIHFSKERVEFAKLLQLSVVLDLWTLVDSKCPSTALPVLQWVAKGSQSASQRVSSLKRSPMDTLELLVAR